METRYPQFYGSRKPGKPVSEGSPIAIPHPRPLALTQTPWYRPRGFQISNRLRESSQADPRINVLRSPVIRREFSMMLDCEPELLEATLLITGTHNPGRGMRKNLYHLDYGGWDSLNVMVYLMDVDSESSCHVVIKGSHRTMSYLDAVRGTISADEAQRRFGPAITEITGPAGLVFFENTEAFHERRCSNKRRAMLNLLYASHRAWLSHGRASQKHLEKRARAFIEVRNTGAEHDAARLEAGSTDLHAPPQSFSPGAVGL